MEEETVVLKGGVEKTVDIKYVWVSGGGCDACADLDGQEFDSADDIPDRPHPNCQCYVDVVEVGGDEDGNGEGHNHGGRNKKGDNEEPCDCWEEEDALIEELEEIVGDAESLADEVEIEIDNVENMLSGAESIMAEIDEALGVLEEDLGQHLPNCENNIDIFYGEISAKKWKLEILIKDILGLLNPLNTLLQSIYNFTSNYLALLYEAYVERETGMDKYYHAKANCENAQLGILGSAIATALSDLKEYYDQYTYVHTHGVSVEEAIADSEEDQAANRIGRERGRNNPTCDCSVLIWDQRPSRRR